MAKKPPNQGKPWTKSDVRTLEKLADGNTPTRVIGLKLGRTATSVRSKAQREGISLKPVNRWLMISIVAIDKCDNRTGVNERANHGTLCGRARARCLTARFSRRAAGSGPPLKNRG